MSDILFENLTKKEISWISNGCGGKNLPIDVPDFVYEDACDKHDVLYWVGGTKEDRKIADRIFYYDMVDAAKEEPWYKRWFFKWLASVYYTAVRLFASSYFYDGQKRTYEDLLEEMKDAPIH